MKDFPIVPNLRDYFEKQWCDKTHMWIVGRRNLPYASQYITATLENYHSNLKAILIDCLKIAFEVEGSWIMPWLGIYELMEEILSHY